MDERLYRWLIEGYSAPKPMVPPREKAMSTEVATSMRSSLIGRMKCDSSVRLQQVLSEDEAPISSLLAKTTELLLKPNQPTFFIVTL
jgi:hypothetical protein